MQLSTTFLALASVFVASSAAQGTLSFTISTCAACSTASGCLIEGSTNLPANRCISIYDGNKSLIITEAANPNCKNEAPEVFGEVGVCEAYGPKNSYKITC
ncbi:uncharacterized protein J4E78_005954 [Alternaria triticimaculans]|uniref:uncharacterized protein n=1 Tax=Alternaria triticimaculans TaxID=297637 RepID=UPI0020C54609|nr:uncharacterized protein J4E78_005954 [Alternaria triticimaculans]KAI4657567.1 hypothetical protein J4E78_005954 [Alternaria triticimaculans]